MHEKIYKDLIDKYFGKYELKPEEWDKTKSDMIIEILDLVNKIKNEN